MTLTFRRAAPDDVGSGRDLVDVAFRLRSSSSGGQGSGTKGPSVITYIDPAGGPKSGVLPYDVRCDLSARPLRIACISNGFPESDRFRDVLARSLAERIPGADVRVFEKEAMLAYTADHLAALQECDAAALVWGH